MLKFIPGLWCEVLSLHSWAGARPGDLSQAFLLQSVLRTGPEEKTRVFWMKTIRKLFGEKRENWSMIIVGCGRAWSGSGQGKLFIVVQYLENTKYIAWHWIRVRYNSKLSSPNESDSIYRTWKARVLLHYLVFSQIYSIAVSWLN